MAIDRRSFLKRSAMTAAALAAPHPLIRAAMGPSIAHASPADPILVLLQLEGGNDGLNTVIPTDDQPGAQQYTRYMNLRPDLHIPESELGPTTIGVDPVKGNTIALHPSMTHLAGRFAEGKLAVINGVGYPSQNLSHFRSEDIWFGGIPASAPFSTGWFGRWLESEYTSSDLVTYDVGESLNPMFFCTGCNALAFRDVDEFVLPDDPNALYADLAAKKLALQQAYAIEADPLETSGVQLTVGGQGDVLFDAMDRYAAVNDWNGSHLKGTGFNFTLARHLREVSSILNYDVNGGGTPTGARYFHVRIGGFDTHSNQKNRHVTLLTRVSVALDAFYQDMVDLGIEDRVLVVTLSEFGRRGAENGGASDAGTDHGAASVLFALGGQVQGGIYGTIPDLNDLDDKGNLKFHTDFRQVYATVIDKWLGTPGDHTSILTGGPFTTLGFIP